MGGEISVVALLCLYGSSRGSKTNEQSVELPLCLVHAAPLKSKHNCTECEVLDIEDRVTGGHRLLSQLVLAGRVVVMWSLFAEI